MAKPSSSSKKTPKNDERNVVAGEAGSIDFDDRVAAIWEKNKTFIIGCIAAVFAIYIGYHAVGFIQRQAEASAKAGYQEADDPEAKLAWAEDESGHPLSGFAFKELADADYSDRDFAAAAERSAQAAAHSEGAIAQAALMGQAMSLLQQKKVETAKGILETLANDEDAANQVEALYRLAEMAYEANNYSEARDYISRIQDKSSQETFYWTQKALTLQMQLPPEDAA